MTIRGSHVSLTQTLQDAVPEGNEQRIPLRDIVKSLGTRSYGPILFFVCLIELLPFISAIPGMYIVTASVIILLSAQLMVGREQPWLPDRLLKVSLQRKNLRDQIRRWASWAKWLDGLSKPRLEFFVEAPFVQAIALLCIVFAIAFFPLSPIPASEKILVLPIAIFAFALMTRDGILVIAGFVFAISTISSLIYFHREIGRAVMNTLEIVGF